MQSFLLCHSSENAQYRHTVHSNGGVISEVVSDNNEYVGPITACKVSFVFLCWMFGFH